MGVLMAGLILRKNGGISFASWHLSRAFIPLAAYRYPTAEFFTSPKPSVFCGLRNHDYSYQFLGFSVFCS
jgi:hypothetical protein